MCGTVVKEIAEKIYANCTTLDIKKAPDDSLKVIYPDVKNGDYTALKKVMDAFKIKSHTAGKIESKFVTANGNSHGITLRELPLTKSTVPDVTGMGARDAVYALENCGLRVSLSGKGRVVSQSIGKGSKGIPGQTVILTLK
jgi:cell division protein FtsI (penicillin-binding protein 3)